MLPAVARQCVLQICTCRTDKAQAHLSGKKGEIVEPAKLNQELTLQCRLPLPPSCPHQIPLRSTKDHAQRHSEQQLQAQLQVLLQDVPHEDWHHDEHHFLADSHPLGQAKEIHTDPRPNQQLRTSDEGQL